MNEYVIKWKSPQNSTVYITIVEVSNGNNAIHKFNLDTPDQIIVDIHKL